jgi:hypothetical protein
MGVPWAFPLLNTDGDILGFKESMWGRSEMLDIGDNSLII